MNWDKYFYDLCKTVGSKSPCLSRQIGCLIVKNNRVVSTGYNGPPAGITHCGHDRVLSDPTLSKVPIEVVKISEIANTCPRRILGYVSGEGLHLCIAQHAESNAIVNAAMLGVATLDASLYLDSVIPCKDCLGKIINAGILEIVCKNAEPYDQHAQWFLNQTDIRVREFKLS